MSYGYNPFPPKPEPDYVEVLPEATVPRIWKSLGQCIPGVEAHYGMHMYDCDMDVDREVELRLELASLSQMLANRAELTHGMALTHRRRHLNGKPLIVRFVGLEYATLYTTRN